MHIETATDELEGDALQWAMAQAGLDIHDAQDVIDLIEEHGIAIDCVREDGQVKGWIAALPADGDEDGDGISAFGRNVTEAATRCLLVQKLGERVSVPRELVAAAPRPRG